MTEFSVDIYNTDAKDFLDVYIEAIKAFYKEDIDSETYLKNFQAMKEYRDAFLDYVKQMSKSIEHCGEFMADAFEKLYNTLYNVHTFKPGSYSCKELDFDIFKLHIWELFICVVTYFLHVEAYKSINELLVHTYFLRRTALGSEEKAVSYEAFRFRSDMLEDRIKPTLSGDLNRKYTLAGHYVCTERAYEPIYSGKKIAEADLFLYQVYKGLNIEELSNQFDWFPTCYVYANEDNSMWKRLKSKRFCEKIMAVFGVDTIEKLKERISRCVFDSQYRYSWGFADSAPAILSWVSLDEVATLP